jgi:hypothetical protein
MAKNIKEIIGGIGVKLGNIININQERLEQFHESVIEDKALEQFRNFYIEKGLKLDSNFEDTIRDRIRQIASFYDISSEYYHISGDEWKVYSNGFIDSSYPIDLNDFKINKNKSPCI